MNAMIAVKAALEREGASTELSDAIAPLFATERGPAPILAAFGFALLRAGTAFDPGIALSAGFKALLTLLPDSEVEALTQVAVDADSDRFFNATEAA